MEKLPCTTSGPNRLTILKALIFSLKHLDFPAQKEKENSPVNDTLFHQETPRQALGPASLTPSGVGAHLNCEAWSLPTPLPPHPRYPVTLGCALHTHPASQLAQITSKLKAFSLQVWVN